MYLYLHPNIRKHVLFVSMTHMHNYDCALRCTTHPPVRATSLNAARSDPAPWPRHAPYPATNAPICRTPPYGHATSPSLCVSCWGWDPPTTSGSLPCNVAAVAPSLTACGRRYSMPRTGFGGSSGRPRWSEEPRASTNRRTFRSATGRDRLGLTKPLA